MKKIFFMVLCLPFIMYSQENQSQKTPETFVIEGIVKSALETVPFANVYAPELRKGISADKNGVFKLENLPKGLIKISVSAVGYKSAVVEVNLTDDKNPYVLQINLKEDLGALDQIVITGTLKPVSKLESPVPVEVYTQSFFKKNPTPSIFESLQNVNGVRPQLNCSVCNTGDIHINGLEGPYTMVLIDGLPIVSGLSTVYGLTGIPQALIERVEIVKGPASTLYGSEAVGGVINVITKKPTGANKLSFDNFTTSWGEVSTDVGTGYQLSDKTSGILGVSYFNYQNPIDNNGDGFTDMTLQNRISIFNKINFDREDGKVFSIAGRYVYEDRWGGEMDWTSADRGGDEVYGESIYTSRWEAFGRYDLPTDEDLSFQFSGNGHSQDSFYGTTSYDADQYIGFGQLTWSKKLGSSHDLLAGAAYRYTYYNDNTFATSTADGLGDLPSVIHLPGVFVQDEIAITDRKKLLLGVRYDYNSIHGNVFSPRVNYKWSSRDKSNVLRLSVGNGFRVANVFTEDHAALTGAREVVFEGELEPETSWNANVNYVKTFRTKNNTFFNLDASAFYTYFTNRILPDYETDFNRIIYSNLDGFAVSQGVSINADVVFRNGLKILAGATLMDVSITEDGERTRQLLTEGYSGVWSISYKIKAWDLNIDYTGNVYGPMRLPLISDTDPRDEFSPVFSVQNIQLSKTFGTQWEVYGGVKNLLNFTPASNSIARAFDPFDEGVQFDQSGQAVATPDNPNALTFDPSYVYASNQGIRGFLGFRYSIF
ncbi:TonB-dependent receptor [Nonlabens sp. Ci31]|uniref:TonB-dependent receptor n=1 Tax=Nonlabens sp. Ci31 TaxID=2608253 RepID=UPI0014639877|nr:TonB-dependent receptor [Nonlabens sp. Ci31]QJP33599.1 TonB-dependent receptor [Nonlabens sp. Ci31]